MKLESLRGKRVVVVGEFANATRADVDASLEALGAKVAPRVTKTTDLVIIGERTRQAAVKPAPGTKPAPRAVQQGVVAASITKVQGRAAAELVAGALAAFDNRPTPAQCPYIELLAGGKGQVTSQVVSRVGGEPIGMTRATWPTHEGEPMRHVITLSREHLAVPLPEHVAAVSVFISALDNNDAYFPDTKETKVVFLTKQDLARGTTTAEATLGRALSGTAPGQVLAVRPRTYDPSSIGGMPSDYAEPTVDPEALSFAMASYYQSRSSQPTEGHQVLGFSSAHPSWVQYPEAPEGHRVLFWFKEELVEGLNCGAGQLYVTADAEAKSGTAFWQC